MSIRTGMKRLFLFLITLVQSTHSINIKEINWAQLGAGTICSFIGLISARLTVKYTKEFINNIKQDWRLRKEIENKGARINCRITNFGNFIENRYELDMAKVQPNDKAIIEQHWKAFQKVNNDQDTNGILWSLSVAGCCFLLVGPLFMHDSISSK